MCQSLATRSTTAISRATDGAARWGNGLVAPSSELLWQKSTQSAFSEAVTAPVQVPQLPAWVGTSNRAITHFRPDRSSAGPARAVLCALGIRHPAEAATD